MGGSSKVNAAPGNESKVLAARNAYLYKRSAFDKGFRGRFDGIVDRQRGAIQLVVRCIWVPMVGEWNDGSGSLSANGQQALREYQARFKAVVESGWGGQWQLQPPVPIDHNYRYRAEVRIETVDGNGDPHMKIYLRSADANMRSNATVEPSGSDPDTNRIMNLKIGSASVNGDVEYHTIDFPFPPTKPEVKFSRCTAVHEFGHHIGLHHPLPQYDSEEGNEQLRAYGDTNEEASGVMGWGSIVKKENYAPFQQIAKAYYAEVARGQTWQDWACVTGSD